MLSSVTSRRVRGRVVKGSGTASRIYGVPTANLQLTARVELNPGVYAATTFLHDVSYPSVVCYRPAPDQVIFEVHLLDWSGDLYNQMVEVEIHQALSEIEPFQNEHRMKEKIHADLERARKRPLCIPESSTTSVRSKS